MTCPKCGSKMGFVEENIEENPHWQCRDCDFFILTDDEGNPEDGPDQDGFGQCFSDADRGL